MAITSAAARQLSDGNSQGTVLGQSSTDKISFYAVSSGPVALQSVSGSLSSGAFASSLANAMKNLGLITYTISA